MLIKTDLIYHNMYAGPHLENKNLVLALDAASPKSYPGSGTTWTDLTGKGLNATLYNGPTFSTDNFGTIVFDGDDDYGQIGSSPLTAITVLTFELWVNRTAIATNTPPYDRIFQKDGGVSGYPAWGWTLAESNPAAPQTLSAYGGGSGEANSTISFTSDANMSLDEWNCYTTSIGPISSGEYPIRNYFNGKLNSSGNIDNEVLDTQDVIRIAIGDGREFKGKIPIVRLYNKVLTDGEVEQNYNAFKNRFK